MTNEKIIREIKQGNRAQDNMYLLYTQNLTLLKRWSKKYIKTFGEEDVLQECYIALYKAVNGYDESKEYKFTSYLQKAVETHLSRASNRSNKTKLSVNDKRLLSQYIELNKKHNQETGTNISLIQAVDLLQCSQNDIKRILRYLSIEHCTSLDKPLGNGSDDDLSVFEILPDKTDIEKDFEQQDTKEQLKQVWDYVHNICTEQEEFILLQCFKENKKCSEIETLSNCLNINVRNIHNKALCKLRHNGKFLKWAKSFDYCIDMSYHYGFNTWKNNSASAVEMAAEVREHYKNLIISQEQRAVEKQKSIMIADMIAKGLLPADFHI